MKKKRLLALVLTIFVALSCVTIPAFAAETQQLTVNNGSTQNQYSPYYSLYSESTNTKCQFIQPANTLETMRDKNITKMTFYSFSWSSSAVIDAIFEVRLMETDTTAFTDSLLDVTNATLVYTGTAKPEAETDDSQVIINFSTPYTYQGGNLLVDFRVKTGSTNPNSLVGVYFYGQNVSDNSGIYSFKNLQYNQLEYHTQNFRPKVTFDYAPQEYFLDLESSDTYSNSMTIDQDYTLSANGNTTYTDTTKVSVEWTLPTIAATYTNAKVWNPDTMSWDDTKTTDTLDEKTATFTFTNYSSVAVGAKVSFEKAIATDTNPYTSDVLTLQGIVNPDTHEIQYTEAPSDTITHTYTPLSTDFNSLSAGSGTYGTYTVSIVSAKKVTFDMQGHGDAIDAQYVGTGGKVTEPTAPTASGYTFDGWYKEAACTNAWNFATDTVTADTTLYAKWTAQ